jgi:hypothetical protein
MSIRCTMMGTDERTVRALARCPAASSISLSLCGWSVACCTVAPAVTVMAATRRPGLFTTTIV